MDPVLKLVIVACLSVLFASAASHKILNRAVFTGQLSAYQLVPQQFVGLFVLIFPLVELGLATALLIPFLTNLALLGAATLLTAYAMVMLTTIMRGRRNIDCGCSGADGATSISYGHVIRNLILSGAAVVAATGPVGRSLSWLDLVFCGLIGLTFIALYQAANQLMANQPVLNRYREA